MRKWEAFALRQRERHVPLDLDRVEHTPVSAPYRLRLDVIESLPIPPIAFEVWRTPDSYLEARGVLPVRTCSKPVLSTRSLFDSVRNAAEEPGARQPARAKSQGGEEDGERSLLESSHARRAAKPTQVHVSATLFDEATGSFFGSTARSQPAVLVQPLDARTVSVALKELVFFHSSAADERVSVVVEVVLSERRGGVAVQSFAVAWAVRAPRAAPPPSPASASPSCCLRCPLPPLPAR